MEENTRFEDAESYSGRFSKDNLTFRDLILQHLKRISQFASVEFRGGYWEIREIPVSVGSGVARTVTNKVYIPDTREVYSNAVECFADMLHPYFDEEMQEAEAQAEKKLEEAYKDNTIRIELDREEEIPEKEKRTFRKEKDKISFRSQRRLINRKLFRGLCDFLNRKNYLELGVLEE